MRRAAFGERHVLGDPEHGGLPARRQRQRKPGRGGKMGLARRRDLMQRAARETAAERQVDRRNAQRKGAGVLRDPGAPLQGLQALAKLVDHSQASEDTKESGPHGQAAPSYCSWFVLVCRRTHGPSSRKGRGPAGGRTASPGAQPVASRRPPERREHQPQIRSMLGSVLEAHQPVGNGVFPNRQMRAAAPPGLRVGIVARSLVHPGEELLRQRGCGVAGGAEAAPARRKSRLPPLDAGSCAARLRRGIATQSSPPPSEELLRRLTTALPWRAVRQRHAGRSTVWISTFNSSVWCTGHLSAISISRLR